MMGGIILIKLGDRRRAVTVVGDSCINVPESCWLPWVLLWRNGPGESDRVTPGFPRSFLRIGVENLLKGGVTVR